jgi:hypothetical protein
MRSVLAACVLAGCGVNVVVVPLARAPARPAPAQIELVTQVARPHVDTALVIALPRGFTTTRAEVLAALQTRARTLRCNALAILRDDGGRRMYRGYPAPTADAIVAACVAYRD